MKAVSVSTCVRERPEAAIHPTWRKQFDDGGTRLRKYSLRESSPMRTDYDLPLIKEPDLIGK